MTAFVGLTVHAAVALSRVAPYRGTIQQPAHSVPAALVMQALQPVPLLGPLFRLSLLAQQQGGGGDHTKMPPGCFPEPHQCHHVPMADVGLVAWLLTGPLAYPSH
jgi:hypothetical protein